MRWLVIVWLLAGCDTFYPPYPDVTPVDGPDISDARVIAADVFGDELGLLAEVHVTWVAEECVSYPRDWGDRCAGGLWTSAYGIFLPHPGETPLWETALAHEFMHELIIDVHHVRAEKWYQVQDLNRALRDWYEPERKDRQHETPVQNHGQATSNSNQRCEHTIR